MVDAVVEDSESTEVEEVEEEVEDINELPEFGSSKSDENSTEEDGEDSTNEPRVRLSLTAQISSILFVAIKPVTIEDLAEATRKDPAVVQEALDRVIDMYIDTVHGFTVVEVAGGYQLRTARAAGPVIKRYKPPKARRLSKAAAETLAVIAYKQPVQRAEIESLRGVDALPTIKTLIESKLVRIVGHENSIGNPALYGTTNKFLEVFGFRDLSELPSIRELEQLADDPGETEDWREASENSEAESDQDDSEGGDLPITERNESSSSSDDSLEAAQQA